MLKPFIYWLVILFPLYGLSQESGINFIRDKTWEEVLKKAKNENKYIFVDCYATWCGPCKQMNQKVYPRKDVGDSVNKHFISIKIQADTSKYDDEFVKAWYSGAKNFAKEYGVAAFPTYLFFMPDGKLVHKEVGLMDVNSFLALVRDAKDPDTQIYSLLIKFKEGTLSYKRMPDFAKSIKTILEDREMSKTVARHYLSHYLYKLPENSLINKKHLEFIVENLAILTSKDKYFRVLKIKGDEVDSLMQEKGFASKIINYIISKEEVYSKIMPSGRWVKTEPNWNKLLSSIQKKYGRLAAERNVMNGKIYWYNHTKKIDSVIKFEIIKIETFGLDTTFWGRLSTNNMIYSKVFYHTTDSIVLNKVINWMYRIIKIEGFKNGASIDTYANLLYKTGRREEAIQWQERAVMLDPKSKSRTTALEKMKRNEPTWLDLNN